MQLKTRGITLKAIYLGLHVFLTKIFSRMMVSDRLIQLTYNSIFTGALPPGDLFALGSKPSKPGESSFQKSSSSGSSIVEKKLSGLGDRKRESASLLAPVGVAKKPKILAPGQTFTPLGRPTDRETEKRLSPVPPVSLAFEESAIEGRFDMIYTSHPYCANFT